MFAVGELVVYGGEGVCRVESIGPSGLRYDGGDETDYHLAPLYRSGTVMTPVDTAGRMRPIVSRDRAMELIASLPQLPPQRPAERGMRFAKDFYHQLVLRCDCGELAAMIHGICHKRAWAVRHGKKVSQMDERYLKRAEEQLYGELAAALDMPRDQVLPFIRQTWEKWPEQLPKQEQESAPAQEAAEAE